MCVPGNVLDPLDLVGRYGTDVLRFTLLTTSSPLYDIALAPQSFELGK